jgi:DNA-binding MarR family transcriptional regulator
MATARAQRRRRELDWGLLPGLLGYALRRAQVAVFDDFARAVPELTPGQFGVLTLIEQNAGLSQSELGEALGVDRSTVVATLDRLQGRGLLARAPSPSDRRAHALELTVAGRDLLADAARRIAKHEARIAGALSAQERRQLMALLARLAG